MSWLSIVIPCYNVAHYLPDCLDSILRNDCDGVEIILVNDGSKDRFTETVGEYFGTVLNGEESRFPYRNMQVVVLQGENEGVSLARNKAIRTASGTYITFIDPDDQISASYFTNLKRHIEGGQSDVLILGYDLDQENCEGNMISSEKVLPREKYFLTERQQVVEQLLPRYLGYSVRDLQDYSKFQKAISTDKEMGTVWRCVYDRHFLIDNEIWFNPNVKCNEDGLFNMWCMAKAGKVDTMMECHYHYTIRPGGAFMNRRMHMVQNKLELLSERIRLVEFLRAEGFGIDLSIYAGSNILSAVELMQAYSRWSQIRTYISHPVVKKSFKIMPFIGNWKFDLVLALAKLRMLRMLFWGIRIAKKMGLSVRL